MLLSHWKDICTTICGPSALWTQETYLHHTFRSFSRLHGSDVSVGLLASSVPTPLTYPNETLSRDPRSGKNHTPPPPLLEGKASTCDSGIRLFVLQFSKNKKEKWQFSSVYRNHLRHVAPREGTKSWGAPRGRTKRVGS